MNLNKKIVLVTGASRGIGKATAIAFAKEGCSVIINFKSDSVAGQEVLEECNRHSYGNLLIQADVSKTDEVLSMFKKIKDQYSQLDILINNAGIFDESDNPTNLEAFENIYRNNFMNYVMVTKFALSLMKEGKIINVSSVHGRLGYGRPEAIAYSAFKAAMESYTKNLAKDVAPKILVNAVAPGRVATPMWGNLSEKEQGELGRAHLIKRMIQPEEIAESIVFLAKNDAICGEVLTIDGGMSLVTLG
ncbi:MAG: SDR family oxidoreductase [Candidatus Vogelbacteria bacterium]|nr:SDR family oxidoreductase [Candidatus Vogelbacteria bacterium]